ncbi:MAG: BrnT family toxin [Deltaproteobacteria bacterium]|nr:BrnT family toxin [Deltaproteobacteria bacterium]
MDHWNRHHSGKDARVLSHRRNSICRPSFGVIRRPGCPTIRSKDKENQSKHGIPFADTFGVFEDPNAVTIEDFRSGERRYVTIGMDAFGRILVVVYSSRGQLPVDAQ